MKIFGQPSQLLVSEREAAFTRLVARIVETLNAAVNYRVAAGETRGELADKIGCHRSSLSRTLNGTAPNLTLQTISDILWATQFEPEDFTAKPIEAIATQKRSGRSNAYVWPESLPESGRELSFTIIDDRGEANHNPDEKDGLFLQSMWMSGQ